MAKKGLKWNIWWKWILILFDKSSTFWSVAIGRKEGIIIPLISRDSMSHDSMSWASPKSKCGVNANIWHRSIGLVTHSLSHSVFQHEREKTTSTIGIIFLVPIKSRRTRQIDFPASDELIILALKYKYSW